MNGAIFLLLAIVLIAFAIAALYEALAFRYHWKLITMEVRQGERSFPMVYMAIMFIFGVLAGHFWQ